PDPWEGIIQRPDAPRHTLPSETKIVDVFDAQGGELFILGPRASGKTTLLLTLTRTLLERAERDEGHPIQVVFHLSSWASERPPFAEWLIAELIIRYYVPEIVATEWVKNGYILPLLDGLDEVRKESQSNSERQELQGACVDAINAFLHEPGCPNIVV